jgi:peptidoglycan/xylan/chitin deacetylase (PgdA/CDA1 family)
MVHHFTSFLLRLVRLKKLSGVIINGHTLTRHQTRLQLDVLGRHFDFIGLEDVAKRIHQPGQRPFCLLTFDDGKRSNFTEIAPELENRRVPAVFYVTTEALSTGNCLWFDQWQQLITQLAFCPTGLELATLKKLPLDELNKRLNRACADYGFVPNHESEAFKPMSWDEARDLARRGFTIGAHGVTHAILTCESRERAVAEIEDSMAKVSAELGSPCTTFAFPNGNDAPELADHAFRCGATSVMTTEPGWVSARSLFWRLPRVQLFGSFSRSRIELKLALAAWRGLLPNPNGSGRDYRISRHRVCQSSPQYQRPLNAN